MTTYQYQHKIAYYLGLDYLKYERLRDLYFERWCYANAKNGGWNYRAMLRSDDLRNWFSDKWHMLVEREIQLFYDDYLNNGVMKEKELHDLIGILFKDILWIYPKVLLEKNCKHEKVTI